MNESMEPMNDPVAGANSQSPGVEPEVDTATRVNVEEFKISGDDLLTKVKELIHQGNIRRILIKSETGQTLLEIPLTVGVFGGLVSAVLFPAVPVLATIGAIGALMARLTIVIERQGQ